LSTFVLFFLSLLAKWTEEKGVFKCHLAAFLAPPCVLTFGYPPEEDCQHLSSFFSLSFFLSFFLFLAPSYIDSKGDLGRDFTITVGNVYSAVFPLLIIIGLACLIGHENAHQKMNIYTLLFLLFFSFFCLSRERERERKRERESKQVRERERASERERE
jgi:hypothetical protein